MSIKIKRFKPASLVFKGKLFKIYQWKQKQFDGSHQIFERAERLDSVQIIASFGKKVIMIKEHQPGKPLPYFGLPGGRVEEGEKPINAAKRELLEETGYESKNWLLMDVELPSTQIKWRIYWYVARDCKKVADPKLDSGEKITVIKMTLDQFLDKISKIWRTTVSEIVEMKYNGIKKRSFSKKLFG